MAGILLLFPALGKAQVPVALMPVPRMQFFNSTGQPLAAGCINFFAAGTSTPQAIYADSSGGPQLQNPLTLDSAGEASVWLANLSYKVVVNTGVVGQTCSSALGTQLWAQDNVSSYQIINQAQNIFLNCATSDPTGVNGEMACRSDLGKMRFFFNTWDSVVEENLAQTLTNKTLVNPVISSSTGAVLNSPVINGTIVPGPPATYLVMSNDLVTGTTQNKLVKINPAGLAGFGILPLISDTGGIVGIAVAGAGLSGNVTIQQNGSTNPNGCVFDNAVTSGDYVQISSTVAGDCHDFGSTYPLSGQVLGRVLATNASPGTYIVDLFGPEIKAGNVAAAIGCTNFTPVTVVNLNTIQTLFSCTIPANTLLQGSLLNVDITGIQSTASGDTLTITTSLGGGTACSTTQTQGVIVNSPWNWMGKFAVLTAGAGGTANWSCDMFGVLGNTAVGPTGAIGTPTIAVNTTISNSLLVQVQMSVANAGNSVTGQLLKAVVF